MKNDFFLIWLNERAKFKLIFRLTVLLFEVAHQVPIPMMDYEMQNVHPIQVINMIYYLVL